MTMAVGPARAFTETRLQPQQWPYEPPAQVRRRRAPLGHRGHRSGKRADSDGKVVAPARGNVKDNRTASNLV